MHFKLLLIGKNLNDEREISKLLEPYYEGDCVEYNDHAKWDWYVIGGRYKNQLVDTFDNKVDVVKKLHFNFKSTTSLNILDDLSNLQYFERCCMNDIHKLVSKQIDEDELKKLLTSRLEHFQKEMLDSINNFHLKQDELCLMSFAILDKNGWCEIDDLEGMENINELWNKKTNDALINAEDDDWFAIIDCHI